ncbi:MAG: HAD hydrolase-like protein [Candidatus Woesearchaeota archaeon]
MIKGIIFDWVKTLSSGSRSLFPYSERVLKECKKRGYKLGLISLAGRGIEERWEDFRVTGILKYFDSVLVGGEKTEEQFLQCMKEMGTTPETTAIVDDRSIRGIAIGNSLGCTTFWIQKGKWAHEAPNKETGEPTYRINTIEDLLTYL